MERISIPYPEKQAGKNADPYQQDAVEVDQPLNSSLTHGMRVSEVKNSDDEQVFLQVHILCNRDDIHWIRPLDKDIQQVFEPSTNKYFRFGEAIRWVLYDQDGHPVGRIAAFVNKKYKNKGDRIPIGGIGFFDCTDDQVAANLLFETAKTWLEARGMQGMDGPINFGERDKWWGLLVHGFFEPLYGMNYNPPYYQQLFENYGFQNYYNQICWTLPVASSETQLDRKFYDAHKKFSTNPDYNASYIRGSDFDKCIRDFCTVYNSAWSKHEGNKEMSYEQAKRLFNGLRPVLDPYLVWFAFYKDKPIAMWISIPDINQILRYLAGKFNLWARLRFMYHKKRGVCDRFVGIIYGIVPEFQGTGVDYFMIVEAEKVIKTKTRYQRTELLWQGDFNPKMLNISKHLGGNHSRTLTTYRFLFDPAGHVERHPVIN